MVRLDGTTATVTALMVRPGVATYNLTVNHLHACVTRAGHYSVHMRYFEYSR